MARARLVGVPAPLLVVAGILSVQFGAALAITLIPRVGVAGAVLLRLFFGAVILGLAARPVLRGHNRSQWLTVLTFGVILAFMNFAFYGAIARLPIGVAVTVEFIGPLGLSAALSRRPRDFGGVAAAALGVMLTSQVMEKPLAGIDHAGVGLALLAGALWASYIVASGRTGAAFPGLDGLAMAFAIGMVIMVPFGVRDMAHPAVRDVAAGAGVAVLSSVIPYSLELVALRRLNTAVFGVLMSLEPAVAAGAGYLVLHQRLSGLQLLGMALVVLASAAVLGRQPGPVAHDP